MKLVSKYEQDKEFEERVNKLHYQFLIEYFTLDAANPVYVTEVQDVVLQKKGVDIEIHALDGSVLRVEIKTDRYFKSPNLFLEDFSDKNAGKLGCTLKCESAVLSYGFYNPQTPARLSRQYLFDMVSLRQWYCSNRSQFRSYNVPNIRGTKAYMTVGRTVPISCVQSFLIAARPSFPLQPAGGPLAEKQAPPGPLLPARPGVPTQLAGPGDPTPTPPAGGDEKRDAGHAPGGQSGADSEARDPTSTRHGRNDKITGSVPE